MKDGYKMLGLFLCVVSVISLMMGAFFVGQININNTIKVEGEVIDMKQEPSGHFMGGYDYFVQLNISIKWYEISSTSYWKVEIGNYIILYESGRAEVIN